MAKKCYNEDKRSTGKRLAPQKLSEQKSRLALGKLKGDFSYALIAVIMSNIMVNASKYSYLSISTAPFQGQGLAAYRIGTPLA